MTNAPFLKDFQESAVAEIVDGVNRVLADESASNSRKIVLDSPTGSGKTRMIAEIISRSLPHALTIVLSPGAGNLEQQTHDALAFFLAGDENVNVKDMNIPLFQTPAAPGTVVVKNWESLTTRNKKTGAYSVYLTKDGDNKNIFDWLTETAATGVPVAIVIDEAHYGNGKDANAIQSFLADVTEAIEDGKGLPPVVIEASATPIIDSKTLPRASCKVARKDVIAAGLMRKMGVLNDGVQDILDSMDDPITVGAEKVLLMGALAKSNELNAEYRNVGSAQHALIAVQIPNSTPGKEAQARTLDFFAEQGLTVENGQVAIFTSQTKTGVIDDISSSDSPIRVLIYKQGIATGWDCPRAQVLVGFRHINSLIFSVQNLGRFSRSTEARHYTLEDSPTSDKLNNFYVYSNISDMGLGFHPNAVKDGEPTEFGAVMNGDIEIIGEFNAYNLPSSAFVRVQKSGMDERKVGRLVTQTLRDKGYELNAVVARGIMLHSGSIDTETLLDEDAVYDFTAVSTAVGAASHEINAKWNERLLSTIDTYGNVANKGALVSLFSRRVLSYYTGQMRAAGESQENLRDTALIARILDVSNYARVEESLIEVLRDPSLQVLAEGYGDDPEAALPVDQRVFKFGGSFVLPNSMLTNKNNDYAVSNGLQTKFLYRCVDEENVQSWRQEALSGPERAFEKMLSEFSKVSPEWELDAIHKNAPFSNKSNFSLALSVLGKEDGKDVTFNFFPDYLVFMKNVVSGKRLPMIVEIKGKNPESLDRHVGAKARAAKQYAENTGLPFVVLTRNGEDSESFSVYGESTPFEDYLESVRDTQVKTFPAYEFGSALPVELGWMLTLGSE